MKKPISIALLSALLAACGGSGGGTTPTQTAEGVDAPDSESTEQASNNERNLVFTDHLADSPRNNPLTPSYVGVYDVLFSPMHDAENEDNENDAACSAVTGNAMLFDSGALDIQLFGPSGSTLFMQTGIDATSNEFDIAALADDSNGILIKPWNSNLAMDAGLVEIAGVTRLTSTTIVFDLNSGESVCFGTLSVQR